MTQHPENKEGVNIDKSKYDTIKSAIFDTLDKQEKITFQNLILALESRLTDFDGSIPWYVTTVKLDLEARGLIERLPKSSPQRLRRISK